MLQLGSVPPCTRAQVRALFCTTQGLSKDEMEARLAAKRAELVSELDREQVRTAIHGSTQAGAARAVAACCMACRGQRGGASAREPLSSEHIQQLSATRASMRACVPV